MTVTVMVTSEWFQLRNIQMIFYGTDNAAASTVSSPAAVAAAAATNLIVYW